MTQKALQGGGDCREDAAVGDRASGQGVQKVSAQHGDDRAWHTKPL